MPIQDIFAYTTSLKSEIENLSVESLKEELAQNPELLLIDIREIQEVVDLGTIPGAIHVDRPRDSACLLYTSPSPRDVEESRMPSSA